MIQHGFLERAHEFRTRAASLEIFLDIAPPHYEFLGRICGVV
jgi:hypothetical protein